MSTFENGGKTTFTESKTKNHSKEILHFDGQFLELEGVFLSMTNVLFDLTIQS